MSASTSSSSVNSAATRNAEKAAMIERLRPINNLEEFAQAVVAEMGLDYDEDIVPDYYVLANVKKSRSDKSKLNKMLLTGRYVKETKTTPAFTSLRVEIQDIGNAFARIGAIGDGNCMVHSLFTAASPTYRKLLHMDRQAVADIFRDVLTSRVGELRVIADVVYAELGGAEAFEETFAQLEGIEPNSSSENNSGSNKSSSSSSGTKVNRSEIDVSMGPLIARMFGFNFLAVRLDERLRITPVGQTRIGRDTALPTIFIHYMGGGRLDFGARGASAVDSRVGHYEVIVRPTLTEDYSPSAESILPESGMVELDEGATTFMMTEADLADVLRLFEDMNANAMNAETKRVFLASIARKRAEGIPISPASASTLAAIERREAREAASAPALIPAKKATSAKKATTAGRRVTVKKANSGNSLSPSMLAAIESMSLANARASGNGGVSPRTLAAIAALEAGNAPKKETSARRSTRKKASPKAAGGAGAPRRSERVRAATQKKKKTSSSSHRSSSSLSPSTLAAILAMESMNNKNGVPNLE